MKTIKLIAKRKEQGLAFVRLEGRTGGVPLYDAALPVFGLDALHDGQEAELEVTIKSREILPPNTVEIFARDVTKGDWLVWPSCFNNEYRAELVANIAEPDSHSTNIMINGRWFSCGERIHVLRSNP